ncbi:TlpA family protein disulfide reductase [uncultured Formosa sp.]|uniref:TlpA family protein disulfide reductase n=1 Tax=uncultured Formosa sp. TaxID=255435 RepID=UPI00262567DA|nr:TlpA family protein disulfide reductase [uncultured Formosa sp.]
MKNIILLVFLCCFACKDNSKKDSVKEGEGQVERSEKTINDVALTIYNFEELNPLLHVKDDNIHVINFWATWCVPCVKELPHFEKLRTEYASKNVQLLLVSLDFPNVYDSKLKPFILKHNIQSKVVALNDPDSETWISKISTTWSGTIPVTLIYNKDKRKFYETPFTYEELEAEVKTFLK